MEVGFTRMETPEAELKAELKNAHDANKGLAVANDALRISRDAAEERYVKQREENSDLEDQLIEGQRQSAVATGKYYAALAALRRRTVLEIASFVLVCVVCVVCVVLRLCLN